MSPRSNARQNWLYLSTFIPSGWLLSRGLKQDELNWDEQRDLRILMVATVAVACGDYGPQLIHAIQNVGPLGCNNAVFDGEARCERCEWMNQRRRCM